MAGEGVVTLKLSKASEGKLNAALQVFAQRAEINKPQVLMQAGTVGANFCKQKCPVDTNRLRVSIGEPMKEGIFELTPLGMMFGTAVNYALAVELGSKEHWIEPGEKGFLAWKDKKTGKWIYTKKRVKHKKTEGQHYMLRGVQAAVPGMVGILSGVLE